MAPKLPHAEAYFQRKWTNVFCTLCSAEFLLIYSILQILSSLLKLKIRTSLSVVPTLDG